MSLLKAAKLGHPIIRKKTKKISIEDLISSDIQRLIDDMIETMRDNAAVGIAANQVYSDKSVVIIEVRGDNPRYADKDKIPLTVFVNPEITEYGEEIEEEWEGCLTLPDFRGKVPRAKKVKVVAFNRYGEKFEIVAEGFLARVIQHEVDHINGMVYADKMSDLSTLTYLSEWEKYWKVS